MHKKEVKKVVFIVTVIFVIIFLSILYDKTGFLQHQQIDEIDKKNWDYVDNVIQSAKSIEYQGSSNECWVMVHGYTSAPDELDIIAKAINKEFDDTVYVPRLHGHGEIPSEIEKYRVDDWYEQIVKISQKHNCKYILGSSMGASIALRYAQEHDVKATFLLGSAFDIGPLYLPMKQIIIFIEPIVRYAKKSEPGQTIKDPAGKNVHTSVYGFPLKPVVDLFDFNKNVLENIENLKGHIVFLHSATDTVASIDSAKTVFEKISVKKEFITISKGNHIIMRDYGKNDAIEKILSVREEYS